MTSRIVGYLPGLGGDRRPGTASGHRQASVGMCCDRFAAAPMLHS